MLALLKYIKSNFTFKKTHRLINSRLTGNTSCWQTNVTFAALSVWGGLFFSLNCYQLLITQKHHANNN